MLLSIWWLFWKCWSHKLLPYVSCVLLCTTCIACFIASDNLLESFEAGVNRSRTFSPKNSAHIVVNSALAFPTALQAYPQIYSILKQHLKKTTRTCFLISIFFLSVQWTYFVNLPARGEKACCSLLLQSFLCHSTPLREAPVSPFVTAWGCTLPEPESVMSDSERGWVAGDAFRTCLY